MSKKREAVQMDLIVDGDCQLKGSRQQEKETYNEAQKSTRSAP
mgnify:FL=1